MRNGHWLIAFGAAFGTLLCLSGLGCSAQDQRSINKAGATVRRDAPPPRPDTTSECKSRDPDISIAACLQFLRDEHSDVERSIAHGFAAYAYERKGMIAEALNQANLAITTDPKAARGYLARGVINMRLSNLEVAAIDISRAQELEPRNALVLFRRGNIRSRRGEFDLALQDYSQAHSLLPKDPYILGDRGITHFNRGEVDKAMSDFNRAIEIDPAAATILLNRGYVYDYLGEQERALADLTRAIELEPKNASALATRGGILNDRSEFTLGAADLDRAQQLNPRLALIYVNRGNAFVNQGIFDRALKEYVQALDFEPNFAPAYRGKCQVHLIRDEPELALLNCNRAIDLGPRLQSSYITRGTYYANRGETDKALADYDRALELVPRNSTALAARGRVHVETGNQERGLTDLDRAIELNAKNRVAYAYRGMAHARSGNTEKSLQDLDKAIQLNPRLTEAWATRAGIYLKQGQRELAIADYRKVLALPARNPRERSAQIKAAETLTALTLGDGAAKAAAAPTGNRSPQAGRRVALVIGNSAYAHVGGLQNPANDAKAIASALRLIGFSEVTEKQNLGLAQMTEALKTFGDRASNADWAVIYFAGHGLEMAGSAYLIPTDAKLEKDAHVPFEAVPLDRMLQTTENAKRMRLVILDACRNNPFVARMVRSGGTARAIGVGLPAIEVEGDVLVAYATKHGQTASDGIGDNSPYALALAENMRSADVDIRVMFGRVRDAVRRATNNQQDPYTYGSIGGDLHYFVASAQ